MTLRRGRQQDLQLLQLGGEELRLADADTILDNGREQHLDHGIVHVADEVDGPSDVLLPKVGVEALQARPPAPPPPV